MIRWVLINKFAELTGYSEKAVRCKIDEGVFTEGVHYRRSPDHRIHISLEAYEQWVEGGQAPALNPLSRRSASASPGRASAGVRRS